MFQQRKHKSFNYKPRFEASQSKKLKEDFKSKWDTVKPTLKVRRSLLTSFSVLLILLIAIVVIIYVLNGYIK